MKILDIDQDRLKQALHVLPKEGIGNVRFGMNPEGVRANFQEEEHFEEWMGGNLNDALLFRGMVFYFDKEESHGPRPDSKMIDFIVRRPDEVWLAGEPLVWWTRENSIARLKQRQIGFSTRYVTMENRRRNYPRLRSYSRY